MLFRSARESLDCALGLDELYNMGVDNVITFDAHDPRVINCAPLNGFENVRASYQFLKGLCKNVPDIIFDADHLMMISPDEGAIDRSVYFASVLGINMGMFYKRRDYTIITEGMNPIVAHEYLGADLIGKDVIVVFATLNDITSFMKIMFFFVHDAIYNSRFVDSLHVGVHLCSFC